MSDQFLRQLSFLVGGNDGTAIEFGEQTPGSTSVVGGTRTGGGFKIEFHVRRGDVETPNTLDARIWNLSPATANKISTREFTQVAVQAGYPGSFGLIFRGVIKQVRIGRRDAKDSYVDITAADGDEAYNYAPISGTLAAGSTPSDRVEYILRAMQKAAINQTITMGYMPELPASGSIRGRVLYGMAKDELRDLCNTYNLKWSIQDGRLTLIPMSSYIPGSAVEVSSSNGLIGVPEQTQNGIEIRTLLNPRLKIGQLINLVGPVNRARLGVGLNAFQQNFNLSNAAKISDKSQYYIMYAQHSGDTRSTEPWFTDLVCLAVDAQVPQSAAPKSVVQPENATIRLN